MKFSMSFKAGRDLGESSCSRSDYRQLGGEVETRNVETRSAMAREERRHSLEKAGFLKIKNCFENMHLTFILKVPKHVDQTTLGVKAVIMEI